MTKGILLLTAVALSLGGAVETEVTGMSGRVLTGVASQYGRGRMESTIRVRQSGRTAYDLPTPVPEADVYFAALDCRDIGKWFMIRPTGVDEEGRPQPWESAYATDCAGLRDGGIGFMLFNRHTPMSRYQAERWIERVNTGEYDPVYVAEVDYETAVRWNTVGRGREVELVKVDMSPEALR
jgi:hypothetical protein